MEKQIIDIFSVTTIDYKDIDRLQNVESKGNVKSKKDFPIIKINDIDFLFKPLSKTKPLLTPFFGCAEVYWSYLVHFFINENAPLYQLAVCRNIDAHQPKFRTQGTLVPNFLNNNETFENLYEYFMENPSAHTNDIKDYVNFCGIYYNYDSFYQTELFQNNPELMDQLSERILISYLTDDQNFHFENPGFCISNEKELKMAPPFDYEFSSFFFNLDNQRKRSNYIEKKYIATKDGLDNVVKYSPNVVSSFCEKLLHMIDFLKNAYFKVDNNPDYFYPFSGNDYVVGIKRYKEQNEQAALEIEAMLAKIEVIPEIYIEMVRKETIEGASQLYYELKTRLDRHTLEKRI